MEIMLIFKLLSLAVSSGMLTEGIKLVSKAFMKTVPPKLVPLVGVLSGEMLLALDRAGSGALSVDDPLQGIGPELAGLAGAFSTWLHQVKYQPMRKPTAFLVALFMPLALALGGCEHLAKWQESEANQNFCRAVPHAVACLQTVRDRIKASDPKLYADLGAASRALTISAAVSCQ